MKINELKAQVSALDIKPGTVVVLRLQQGTPATLARQMGEEIQKHIPFGTQIFVLPSGEDIEALDEAKMRELGWVRASGAAQDVIAERQRQVTAEGWTPKHDDQYSNGAMADAAGCYALHAHDSRKDEVKGFVPAWWPWHAEWWKPTNPRRDLVKAGALILAEIERIDRETSSQG